MNAAPDRAVPAPSAPRRRARPPRWRTVLVAAVIAFPMVVLFAWLATKVVDFVLAHL